MRYGYFDSEIVSRRNEPVDNRSAVQIIEDLRKKLGGE